MLTDFGSHHQFSQEAGTFARPRRCNRGSFVLLSPLHHHYIIRHVSAEHRQHQNGWQHPPVNSWRRRQQQQVSEANPGHPSSTQDVGQRLRCSGRQPRWPRHRERQGTRQGLQDWRASGRLQGRRHQSLDGLPARFPSRSSRQRGFWVRRPPST